MGFCSKRHFLLTICTLQLITTIERQVFDFLGFMWVPILINFFNTIFVILGFFGAFQYRPKYIISYCVWNVLWLGWNIFLTCFYLSAGVLDKNSDLLNLGTGSFSWWQVNGPGCKPHRNNTVPDPPDVYRPDRVTGCVLDYEVIEVLHSSTQCLLAVMAVIGGVCLSRVFLEEDDSFDFVGGGDFGMAGHTSLHPMYVSYSALPPPAYMHSKHSATGENYYYPTNTGTTSGSHRSSSTTLISPAPNDLYGPSKKVPPTAQAIVMPYRVKAIPRHVDGVTFTSDAANVRRHRPIVDYADYSNPIDQLHAEQRHHLDYDSLEAHSPNLSVNRHRYYQRNVSRQIPPVSYSPLMRTRQLNRPGNPVYTGSNSRNRNSYRPRVYADHIRERQQQPQRLRSFHSDPRLSVEEQSLNVCSGPRDEPRDRSRRRDGRPLSMFVSNY